MLIHLRPLTEEMLYYARSDTHYLLYIYDMLRNELVEKSDQSIPEKNLIELVLQKSKEVSLLRHESLTADPVTGQGPRGWFNPLTRTPSAFNSEQFAVYRAVHKWRDDIARRDDESPMFIMPPYVLADIAKIMPSDPKALWSLFRDSSQSVRRSVDELFTLIQDARAQGVNGPTMIDFFRGDTVGSIASHIAAKNGKDGAAEVPAAKELRSNNSQLWGTVPLSSVWDQASLSKATSNVQIAVPWSHFVQGMREGVPDKVPGQAAEVEEADVDMLPLEDAKEDPVPDTEFTLRAGRKRKAEGPIEVSTTAEAGSDEELDGEDAADVSKPGSEDDEEIQKTREDAKVEINRKKRERKERKKEKKNANKKARNSDTNENNDTAGDDEDGEEAYDYSKAQSVLHAQRASSGTATRTFDPYAAKMRAEGPKAARRMQHEKAGKSATFRK